MNRPLPLLVASLVFAVFGLLVTGLFLRFRGEGRVETLAVIAITAFALAVALLASGVHSLARRETASRFVKALETIRRYMENDSLRNQQDSQ